MLHARHAEIVAKENMFGQLTVRFNTQQTLAVYDRYMPDKDMEKQVDCYITGLAG